MWNKIPLRSATIYSNLPGQTRAKMLIHMEISRSEWTNIPFLWTRSVLLYPGPPLIGFVQVRSQSADFSLGTITESHSRVKHSFSSQPRFYPIICQSLPSNWGMCLAAQQSIGQENRNSSGGQFTCAVIGYHFSPNCLPMATPTWTSEVLEIQFWDSVTTVLLIHQKILFAWESL